MKIKIPLRCREEADLPEEPTIEEIDAIIDSGFIWITEEQKIAFYIKEGWCITEIPKNLQKHFRSLESAFIQASVKKEVVIK